MELKMNFYDLEVKLALLLPALLNLQEGALVFGAPNTDVGRAHIE